MLFRPKNKNLDHTVKFKLHGKGLISTEAVKSFGFLLD